MHLIAANLGSFVWLLLVLACPLMMVFMMRGVHGGHAHGGDAAADRAGRRATMSIDELKRERDELNALIGERAEEAVEGNR